MIGVNLFPQFPQFFPDADSIQITIEIAWNQFRLGNSDGAVLTVLDALERYPDSEHLKETLTRIFNENAKQEAPIPKELLDVPPAPPDLRVAKPTQLPAVALVAHQVAAQVVAPAAAQASPAALSMNPLGLLALAAEEKGQEAAQRTRIVITISRKPKAAPAADVVAKRDVSPPKAAAQAAAVDALEDPEPPRKRRARRRADEEVLAGLDTNVVNRRRRSLPEEVVEAPRSTRACSKLALEAIKKQTDAVEVDEETGTSTISYPNVSDSDG